jgi:Ca2+-binding EF-hand superfamily protein
MRQQIISQRNRELQHRQAQERAEVERRAEAARLLAMPDEEAERKAARQRAVENAQRGLNTRFADMHRAFKHVDLDNSGTVDRQELKHFLEMCNVPMTSEQLDLLWAECDENQNGEISYAEFINVLARDTVSNSGKLAPAGPMRERKSVEEEVKLAKLREVEEKLAFRFRDMRKAFKHIDRDGSGTLNKMEIKHAIKMMNIDMNEEQFDYFWQAWGDADGSGEVDYEEFCNGLMAHHDDASTGTAMRKF